MKNLFKITDAKIIITAAVIIFGGFYGLMIYNMKPVEKVNEKTFVGVDAAGFKHYPNGDIERMK